MKTYHDWNALLTGLSIDGLGIKGHIDGIVLKKIKNFKCTPRLPKGWDRMSLQNIRAFGSHFDLTIQGGKEKGQIPGSDLCPNKL